MVFAMKSIATIPDINLNRTLVTLCFVILEVKFLIFLKKCVFFVVLLQDVFSFFVGSCFLHFISVFTDNNERIEVKRM